MTQPASSRSAGSWGTHHPGHEDFHCVSFGLARLTALWAQDEALAGAFAATAGASRWLQSIGLGSRGGELRRNGQPGYDWAGANGTRAEIEGDCSLHVEAFSGAEFLHGPIAMVSSICPILMFMPADAAAAGMREPANNL
jgi:glucosamine--fructose-6-phosphate aminotransferase (isomerizing)